MTATGSMSKSATRFTKGRRVVRCPLAVALLVLLPPNAAAQARDTSRTAAAEALKVGQHVRLDVTRVGRIEGRFAVRSDSTMTLMLRDDVAEVRLPDVERLWVRGRATGKGALIGGLVGLAGGATYGLLIGEIACAETDCTRAEVAAIAGLLFGAGGAVVGTGVGFAIPTWRLRFP